MYLWQRFKISVFSLRLKDGADVTSTGKVFHTLDAAIGKARLPIVLCFERGTIRAAVEADHSRRPESTLDAR